MAELVKHGDTCTECKGRVKGRMNVRVTAYDGQGRADRTYICNQCRHTVVQNEVDPRVGHPEVGVGP